MPLSKKKPEGRPSGFLLDEMFVACYAGSATNTGILRLVRPWYSS